ncbi:MAG: NrsF family protein [Neorhizobium sp.]|nr:NrsF family protein [Neorhizobium sp.]
MAKTDDMIERLVGELKPVPATALQRLLVCAMLPGLVLSAAFIFFLHGPRPDLTAAMATPAFWVKSVYPLILALVGISGLMVVARPGGLPRGTCIGWLAIYLALVTSGLWQLGTASDARYPLLIFGRSWWICPIIIMASALPVFVANFWFLRRAAPTHIRLAGFVAGLTAGAVGAWTYSWGCMETGLPFVAIWYTLGIVLCGVAGALCARPLLRW